MSVLDMNDLKGHRSGAVDGVFVAAGWTKTAFASKRNKFKMSAVRTAIHGTAEGGGATMDHPIDIFHNGMTRMIL